MHSLNIVLLLQKEIQQSSHYHMVFVDPFYLYRAKASLSCLVRWGAHSIVGFFGSVALAHIVTV